MGIIEILQGNPQISIIFFAFLITVFITLVTKLLTDGNRMKELKGKQKELQAKMKEHKHNPEKMAEFQKEMFSNMGETMKSSFKPMLITLIPLLVFFGWLKNVFATPSNNEFSTNSIYTEQTVIEQVHSLWDYILLAPQ